MGRKDAWARLAGGGIGAASQTFNSNVHRSQLVAHHHRRADFASALLGAVCGLFQAGVSGVTTTVGLLAVGNGVSVE